METYKFGDFVTCIDDIFVPRTGVVIKVNGNIIRVAWKTGFVSNMVSSELSLIDSYINDEKFKVEINDYLKVVE